MKHKIYKIISITCRKIQQLLGIPTLGVRAIVLNKNNEILLVKHSYEAGWFLPGGKVDRNESIQAAIKRELIEETGVCVVGEPKLFAFYINNILGATDYPFVFVVDEYYKIDANSPEIAEYRWYKYNELPETTSPGSQRRLKEYFSNIMPSERW